MQLRNSFDLPPDTRAGVILAHPDDEMLLAHAIQQLATLYNHEAIEDLQIYYASDGEAGMGGDLDIRPAEALASMASLGIDQNQVNFGRRPDGQLATDPGLSDSMRDFVKYHELTMLLTMGEGSDGHPDHDATNTAALEVSPEDMAIWALNGQHQGRVRVTGMRRRKLDVMKHHPTQFSVQPGIARDRELQVEGHIVDRYTASVLRRYGAYLLRETYDRHAPGSLALY